MHYIAFTWPLDADQAEVEEQIADQIGPGFDGPIELLHKEEPVEDGEHGLWLFQCPQEVYDVTTHHFYDGGEMLFDYWIMPEIENGPVLLLNY